MLNSIILSQQTKTLIVTTGECYRTKSLFKKVASKHEKLSTFPNQTVPFGNKIVDGS